MPTHKIHILFRRRPGPQGEAEKLERHHLGQAVVYIIERIEIDVQLTLPARASSVKGSSPKSDRDGNAFPNEARGRCAPPASSRMAVNFLLEMVYQAAVGNERRASSRVGSSYFSVCGPKNSATARSETPCSWNGFPPLNGAARGVYRHGLGGGVGGEGVARFMGGTSTSPGGAALKLEKMKG